MMEELRGKFLKRCEEDLEVVRAGPLDPAFKLVVHRLSGVAPMFGFDALGEVAGQIDDALYASRSPTPNQVQDLARALEIVLAECGASRE